MIDEITVLRVGVDVSVMTVIRADPGSALSTASLLDTSPFSVSLQCVYGQHYVSPRTSFSTHAVICAHCGKTFVLVVQRGIFIMQKKYLPWLKEG